MGLRSGFAAVVGFVLALGVLATPGGDALAAGQQRIDFDERLIKGQTAKAGGVYLFDRKQIDGEILVRRSRLFRQRIIRTVFEEGTSGAR